MKKSLAAFPVALTFASLLPQLAIAQTTTMQADAAPASPEVAAPLSAEETARKAKIQADGDAALKSILDMRESFKHWRYETDANAMVDRLTGKEFPFTETEAKLFSKQGDDEKRYIIMHITATRSATKRLRKKLDIWFVDTDKGIVSENSGRSFCTHRSCKMRFLFDSREPIYVDMVSDNGQDISVKEPARILAEIKRSSVMKVEVPYIDSEGGEDGKGGLHARIYPFEVKGFKADYIKE